LGFLYQQLIILLLDLQ